MKEVLLGLLFLNYGNFISAQSDFVQATGVIHKVPFIIKSQDYLVSFNHKDTFQVQAGRLEISHFDRNTGVVFDQLLQIDAPNQKIIGLRLGIIDGSIKSNRIRYLHNKTKMRSQIIDTFLNYGNNLTLVWVNEQLKIVQSIVFDCSKQVPNIIGFRPLKEIDSISQMYKSRRLNKDTAFPIEYTKQLNKVIKIKALGNLELLIQKQNLIIDSVIQFRVFDQKSAPFVKWVNTGHLITLNNIQPGSNYFLELRYKNQFETNLIEIIAIKEFYQQLWFIIACFIGVLVLVYFTLKWYYRRKIAFLTNQRNRVEDKLKMLQSQLNPHFVFNALSSIEGLVTAGENELANQYLANFSSILRETLRNMDKILLSLEEELNLIDKYCKVEQLRFGFQYKIVIDESINKTAIELPPLLLQPVVENAIKHGLAGLGKNGYLEIAINKKEKNLEIFVKNNRTNSYVNIPTAGGFGLKYLNQRIVHFNQLNPDTPITYQFQLFDKEAISIINLQNLFL